MFLQEKEGLKNLVLLYVLGFLAGTLFLYFNRDKLVESTGFMGIYALGPVKYLDLNHVELLFDIVCHRIGCILILLLLSTTYLAESVCYGMCMWNSICLGMIFGGTLLQYGIKGILVFTGCVLPQYMLYLPCLFFTILLCLKIRKRVLVGLLPLKMLLLLVVTIIGCLLECYVNPLFLKAVL